MKKIKGSNKTDASQILEEVFLKKGNRIMRDNTVQETHLTYFL